MKETIYTIPLTDAFMADDECPFCFIERKLEQEAVSFIMGPAYMEDDIREATDKLGFCRHHYKMMYDYGNKLGNALILHTYYQKLNKELSQQMNNFTPQKASFIDRMKKSPARTESSNALSGWLKERELSCYVCNHINDKYPRYIDTFLQLVLHDADFMALLKKSKGLCLHHFADILDTAEVKLKDKDKEALYPVLFERMIDNFKRLEDDISWFVNKYDYRNKEADWKTSRDAIQRCIQKLTGGYPDDPVYNKL